MKEVNENPNEQGKMLFLVQNIQHNKHIFFLPKFVFRLNAIHNKIPEEFLFGGGAEIDKTVIKFLLKGIQNNRILKLI